MIKAYVIFSLGQFQKGVKRCYYCGETQNWVLLNQASFYGADDKHEFPEPLPIGSHWLEMCLYRDDEIPEKVENPLEEIERIFVELEKKRMAALGLT